MRHQSNQISRKERFPIFNFRKKILYNCSHKLKLKCRVQTTIGYIIKLDKVKITLLDMLKHDQNVL